MDTSKTAAAFAEIAILASLSPEMLAGLALARAVAHVIDAYAYPIEDGCLENLDYESHARGKNWIATVRPNRAAPGGLDRTFWKHGSKAWYAIPAEGLRAGDVIEMAGDYYTGRGSKRPDRRYILVVRAGPGYVVGVFLGETAPSTKSLEAARAKCLPAPEQIAA